jgi:hypothetical protein
VVMVPSIDDDMQRAVDLQRTGQAAQAEALYRAVLEHAPDIPEAHHNLGVLLAMRSAITASIEHFKHAIELAPNQEVYWLSYARCLLAAQRPDDAAGVLERARALGHGSANLDAMAEKCWMAADTRKPTAADFDTKGRRLCEEGRVEDAVRAFCDALELDPGFAPAHFHLGSLYSENGQINAGFSHFLRHADIIGGEIPGRPGADLPHKLKHDVEQLGFLVEARSRVPAGPVTNFFHVESGDRLNGSTVNRHKSPEELLSDWREAVPQAVVIDDFLTAPALAALRRFCALSTVWRRVYAAGYIGATPEDGFSCPLLAQIVNEVREAYAPIIGLAGFRYLGGFKYDSTLSTGTNTHADNSAINVNLYIAPDDANLDPDCGGMEIWSARPESEAALRLLNGNEAAARDFITASNAQHRSIAHSANRAVIFRSDQLHRTDRCQFREGYLNKRINISMLFGDRAA